MRLVLGAWRKLEIGTKLLLPEFRGTAGEANMEGHVPLSPSLWGIQLAKQGTWLLELQAPLSQSSETIA